jgi:hypothetical protein
MRVFPLDADGGMTWIWALGYMFVRLEGSVASGAVSVSFAAHGGVLPLLLARERVVRHALYVGQGFGDRLAAHGGVEVLAVPAPRGSLVRGGRGNGAAPPG